jgi:hypothetical protein
MTTTLQETVMRIDRIYHHESRWGRNGWNAWEIWRTAQADASQPWVYWTHDPTAADTLKQAWQAQQAVRVTWRDGGQLGAQVDGCEVVA